MNGLLAKTIVANRPQRIPQRAPAPCAKYYNMRHGCPGADELALGCRGAGIRTGFQPTAGSSACQDTGKPEPDSKLRLFTNYRAFASLRTERPIPREGCAAGGCGSVRQPGTLCVAGCRVTGR